MAELVKAAEPRVPPAPTFSVLESVPARVSVLDTVRVFPAARVRVPVPVVMVFPLTVVATAAPMFGVTRTGEVVRTTFPVPLEATP